MTRGLLTTALLATSIPTTALVAGDWNQWRGPDRNGVASVSPQLIEQLPAGGLVPLWSVGDIPSAWTGGWGSPVVQNGRAYLFVHSRGKKENLREPKREYPWVEPENRTDWTDEQFEEYEKHRRDEDEAIGKAVYSFQETLYCVDTRSGDTLWKSARDSVYTRFLQSGSPSVVDGKVFVLAAAYTVRSFDAHSGKPIWERRLPGEFRDEFRMASIAVIDGVAIVQAGRLFGIDARSGEVLWEGDAEHTEGSHSSPVSWRDGDDVLVIANASGGKTVCVDPRTGKERWSVDSQAGLSTPVVVGRRLVTFGNSRKKGLRCFDLSTGGAEHVWTYNRIADKGSSPVVVDGNVFVQGERRLACVDLETGEERWTTTLRLKSPQFTSLLAADDKVFYACEGLLAFEATAQAYRPLVDGKFGEDGLLATAKDHRRRLALDELEKQAGGRKKAAELWAKSIGGSGPLECASPAFFDGRLLLRTAKGLTCYDLRVRPRQ